MTKSTITVTTEVELDVETAAKWFSGLSDERQAQFFVEVAKAAKSWDGPPDMQWNYVAGHLVNCKCSTDDARSLIKSLHDHMMYYAGKIGIHVY